MKKVIRLNESDIENLVKKIINESENKLYTDIMKAINSNVPSGDNRELIAILLRIIDEKSGVGTVTKNKVKKLGNN